jgi:hypothetical protein
VRKGGGISGTVDDDAACARNVLLSAVISDACLRQRMQGKGNKGFNKGWKIMEHSYK